MGGLAYDKYKFLFYYSTLRTLSCNKLEVAEEQDFRQRELLEEYTETILYG